MSFYTSPEQIRQTTHDTITNIGNAYYKQADDAQQRGAIEKILSDAQVSGDPMVLQQSIGKILSQVSPDRQAPALQYIQSIANNMQKQRSNKALREVGVNADLPEKLQEEQFKQKNSGSGSQKSLNKGLAEEFSKVIKSIPGISQTASITNRLEILNNELAGAENTLKGYTTEAGRAKMSELSSLGLAAVEPILKIFNPVGAIPIAKINLIKDQFAPDNFTTAAGNAGKIKALRFLSNRAKIKAQNYIDLLNKYGDIERIPYEEYLKLSDEGAKDLDEAQMIMESSEPKKDISKPFQELNNDERVRVKRKDGRIGSILKSDFEKNSGEYELVK